jgi:aerobic-type carbon monoxide dehydrogenase small subunit (CoxS/CutS family)
MTQSLEDILECEVLLQCRLNGTVTEELIPPGLSLLDFLRDRMRLTGTHMGCMTGHCGACTVLIDGRVAKSCLTMAACVSGRALTTVEGLAAKDGSLSDIQQAFRDANAFQCGFCAPGMILATVELLQSNSAPDEEQIREALSGNLCRCTGYRSIVAAVQLAVQRARAATDQSPPADRSGA